MTVQEQWKSVARDPRYEVSNFGRVRSTRFEFIDSIGRICTRRGRVLQPGRASHGYLTVALGRGNTVAVHVLVAEAFVGPKPFYGAEVRHIDGDEDNFEPSNLVWGTRTQNIRDNKWQGKHRKLTGEQAAFLKARLDLGETGASLARDFGVSESLVSAIKHGRVHVDA